MMSMFERNYKIAFHKKLVENKFQNSLKFCHRLEILPPFFTNKMFNLSSITYLICKTIKKIQRKLS